MAASHPPPHPTPVDNEGNKGAGLNLKGLGFLRTKSLPSGRRDQCNSKRPRGTSAGAATTEGEPVDSSAIPPLIDEKTDHLSPSLSTPVSPDGDHLREADSTDGRPLKTGSAPNTRAPSPSGLGSSKKPAANPVTMTQHRHNATQSRSHSPAPSLEAVLLERKRRLTATAGVNQATGAGTSVATSAGSGHSALTGGIAAPRAVHASRGNAFKSSPLSFGTDQKDRVVLDQTLGQQGGPAPQDLESLSDPRPSLHDGRKDDLGK